MAWLKSKIFTSWKGHFWPKKANGFSSHLGGGGGGLEQVWHLSQKKWFFFLKASLRHILLFWQSFFELCHVSLLERVWKWKRCWFCHPHVTFHPTSFSNETWPDDKRGDCEKILISVISEIPCQVLGFVLRPGKSLNADTGPECPRSKQNLQIPSRSRNSSRWT